MTADAIVQVLRQYQDSKRAQKLQKFFKTGKGEYGQADVFWGIRVPQLRTIAQHYTQLSLVELEMLLHSLVHECRFTALVLLVQRFKKANEGLQKSLLRVYLRNTHMINNWDLVDISAPYIIGPFLTKELNGIQYRLAASHSLWERRIAVLSHFYLIRKERDYEQVLDFMRLFFCDSEDLIHKAVGWMLRELGKRNQIMLEKFLDLYATQMPRVMLRYAIEKFNPQSRRLYLSKKI